MGEADGGVAEAESPAPVLAREEADYRQPAPKHQLPGLQEPMEPQTNPP